MISLMRGQDSPADLELCLGGRLGKDAETILKQVQHGVREDRLESIAGFYQFFKGRQLLT
jgi:hypothetical protein